MTERVYLDKNSPANSEASVVADQASLIISKIHRHIAEDNCSCCRNAIEGGPSDD